MWLGRKSNIACVTQDLASLHTVTDLYAGCTRQRVHVLHQEATSEFERDGVPFFKVGSVDASAAMPLCHLFNHAAADSQHRCAQGAPQIDRVVTLREKVRQVAADALRAQVRPVGRGQWEAEAQGVLLPPRPAAPAISGTRHQRAAGIAAAQRLEWESANVCAGSACIHISEPQGRARPDHDDECRHHLHAAILQAVHTDGEGLPVPVQRLDAGEGQEREACALQRRVRHHKNLVVRIPLERRLALCAWSCSMDQRVRPVHDGAAHASLRQIIPKYSAKRSPSCNGGGILANWQTICLRPPLSFHTCRHLCLLGPTTLSLLLLLKPVAPERC
mmetsp:Transcript_136947/g.355619  ORF Transcript_136947/g.355619 Transcript_136947/m.355619 type:complete len:332 (-) Transcript_136947:21-1016(-)